MSADPSPQSAPDDKTPPGRLMSLDALRGFDMFWIIGGAEWVIAICFSISDHYGERAKYLLEHPDWHGYTPYDQIFPLFMFIAGVAIPFSLLKHLEEGQSKAEMYIRVIYRGLALCLLGAIYNGLLKLDFEQARYPSVLGRIGLSYMFAALIAMNTRVRGQVIWTAGILIGYWALMMFVPVPGYGAGDLVHGHTWETFLDSWLIPGTMYNEIRDPEGLISTIPSIATVLSGVLAGQFLRSERSGAQKALCLLAAGAICAVAGRVLHPIFPVNKNLWTSTFVLYTTGWSTMALSLFYLVIDVWGYRKWAFVFVVIGMNAITIYLVREFIHFPRIFEFIMRPGKENFHPAIWAGGEFFLVWLFLYVLYRNKIFLRV